VNLIAASVEVVAPVGMRWLAGGPNVRGALKVAVVEHSKTASRGFLSLQVS
jgi:hypothetical protein